MTYTERERMSERDCRIENIIDHLIENKAIVPNLYEMSDEEFDKLYEQSKKRDN